MTKYFYYPYYQDTTKLFISFMVFPDQANYKMDQNNTFTDASSTTNQKSGSKNHITYSRIACTIRLFTEKSKALFALYQ